VKAKNVVAAVLLAAFAGNARVAQNETTYTGVYVWGHEVESFKPCGQKLHYWASVPESLQSGLREIHRANTTRPYQGIYVSLQGHVSNQKADGFAESYDGIFEVTAVLDMSKEVPSECLL
jgi:uncharacterized protein (DUF2147 family)